MGKYSWNQWDVQISKKERKKRNKHKRRKKSEKVQIKKFKEICRLCKKRAVFSSVVFGHFTQVAGFMTYPNYTGSVLAVTSWNTTHFVPVSSLLYYSWSV